MVLKSEMIVTVERKGEVLLTVEYLTGEDGMAQTHISSKEAPIPYAMAATLFMTAGELLDKSQIGQIAMAGYSACLEMGLRIADLEDEMQKGASEDAPF